MPKRPVGRPHNPITPTAAKQQIDALQKLLGDGDISMKQFHALKDAIIARLVGGEWCHAEPQGSAVKQGARLAWKRSEDVLNAVLW
ncbi:MAG TPA: hypothetical protein VGS20_14805 [Candidatus Acidoferrales bacterium]|nr:hypothetical protein [Candidatus Acidoferrales bacterium]